MWLLHANVPHTLSILRAFVWACEITCGNSTAITFASIVAAKSAAVAAAVVHLIYYSNAQLIRRSLSHYTNLALQFAIHLDLQKFTWVSQAAPPTYLCSVHFQIWTPLC